MPSFSHLFTRSLLAKNPAMAARFKQWLWEPGMGFQDTGLWWGREKKRISLHEGVDFVRFRDRNGKVCNFVSPLAVPTIFPGEIARFHRDFLAWSLYIRHPQFVLPGRVLYTVFGHLQIGNKVCMGQRVVVGEVVGSLEKYRLNNAVPLHLHLTIAWISEVVAPEQLSWQLLNDRDLVTLVDPRTDCPLI
ncbi:MAG: hypothetical protein JRF04_01885 [Deltaproteobacteria bacterium]|nr:hypothetical protein [Deltaproteobacteria bacterium]